MAPGRPVSWARQLRPRVRSLPPRRDSSVGGTWKANIVSSPEKRADRPSQIRGQLDYHARRLALYQRLHGSRPSSRLTELEKAYHTAQQRMAGAGERDLPGPGASART